MGTTRNLFNLAPDFERKANQVKSEINQHIPISVGELLVDGFRESWKLQKFNDHAAMPWREVKRRTKGDAWYGFRYVPGGSAQYIAPSGSRPRRSSSKYFSPRATSRGILYGAGSTNLRDSIYLKTATRGRIIIASDQPHAAVHNEGLTARIFGRKLFTMPKRQFMGTSHLLNIKAYKLITKRLNKIL